MLYQLPTGGPLPLDPSNSIARRITALFMGDFAYDIVSMVATVASSRTGSITSVATPVGPAKKITGNATIDRAKPVFGNGDLTVLFVGTPAAGGTTGNLITQTGSAGSIWVGTNTDEFNGAVSGQLAMGLLQTGVSRSSVKAAGATDGTTACYLITKSAGAGRVWKNGKKLTVVTTGSLAAAPTAAADTVSIGGDPSNSGASLNAPVALIVVMDGYSPTDAECKSFTENPAQIFLDQDEDDEALMFGVAGGGLTVTYDGMLVADWSSSTLNDALMRIEWIATRQRDSVWPAESGATLRADAPVPVDTAASVRFDRAAPAEWIAPVRADALASADWTLAVVSNSQVQVELAMQVRADGALPAEWAGMLSVTADSLLPLEWRTAVSMDARGAAEWLGLMRSDAALLAEFSAGRTADMQMPVAPMTGLQVDGIALADWTGGMAITNDGRMPLEWLGGVLVTANAVLPLEFGAGRVVDATLQASWSAALIADRQIPADFNMGLIANQQGALDWLRSVFGDAVLPGETLVVITGSAGAPLEFGGASSFVPGNTEIFRIDARGYIWRVDARSTIWLPASR